MRPSVFKEHGIWWAEVSPLLHRPEYRPKVGYAGPDGWARAFQYAYNYATKEQHA